MRLNLEVLACCEVVRLGSELTLPVRAGQPAWGKEIKNVRGPLFGASGRMELVSKVCLRREYVLVFCRERLLQEGMGEGQSLQEVS